MRTIDADVLLSEIQKKQCEPEYLHNGEGWYVGLWSAETLVRFAPTIEPERKRGRWVKNDNNTYSCNKCQSWIPEEQYYYANFCLYCGADMRGGRE